MKTTKMIRNKLLRMLGVMVLLGVVFTSCSDDELTNPTSNFRSVISPFTGKTWMDRNLGAFKVPASINDSAAYGDLYQWGRAADGHEKRNSEITTDLSTSNTPGHGKFITVKDKPFDWRSPLNSNLWQDVNGTNNPCPIGYRLPTKAEWDAELKSWDGNGSSGAFDSPLKLTMAGTRDYFGGKVFFVGFTGVYWSSTVEGEYSAALHINEFSVFTDYGRRANGYSVRCIKGESAGIAAPEVGFMVSKTFIPVGVSVSFKDLSTNYPTSWEWGFGDGSTSSLQNPMHTYTTAGSYTLSLTATNNSGSNTETKTDYITVVELAASDVYSPTTGRIWMDRNLGATRVASSPDDETSYGDLYQWGRAADGHEKRNSEITSVLSSIDMPDHGKFIIVDEEPRDWRSVQNDNLWQGLNGANNPCPNGYRLPSVAEWEAESASWYRPDAEGAFDSPLKLPSAGFRIGDNGRLDYMALYGGYWSRTVSGNTAGGQYFGPYYEGVSLAIQYYPRSMGLSVRCLKF